MVVLTRNCLIVGALNIVVLPPQIARGLRYLHSKEIVHMDMKSPNVLIWHFPSPEKRVQEASRVVIKIADCGISKLSTGLTMRVPNTTPIGTPGFMAPELFGEVGKVISSEKVRRNGSVTASHLSRVLFFMATLRVGMSLRLTSLSDQ
jgi:serine/threonine protein kinase